MIYYTSVGLQLIHTIFEPAITIDMYKRVELKHFKNSHGMDLERRC